MDVTGNEFLNFYRPLTVAVAELSESKGFGADGPHKHGFQPVVALALIHCEVSEAYLAVGVDKHLRHRTAEEVEWADTILRACDLIGRLKLTHSVPPPTYSNKPSRQTDLLATHARISRCVELLREGRRIEFVIWDLVAYCDHVICSLDISRNGRDIVSEKHEFNRTRPHKHGGKLF